MRNLDEGVALVNCLGCWELVPSYAPRREVCHYVLENHSPKQIVASPNFILKYVSRFQIGAYIHRRILVSLLDL